MASSLIKGADPSAAGIQEKKRLAEQQAGKAAPDVDADTGTMINPHNPSFITNVPWYLAQEGGTSLRHQK